MLQLIYIYLQLLILTKFSFLLVILFNTSYNFRSGSHSPLLIKFHSWNLNSYLCLKIIPDAFFLSLTPFLKSHPLSKNSSIIPSIEKLSCFVVFFHFDQQSLMVSPQVLNPHWSILKLVERFEKDSIRFFKAMRYIIHCGF